MAQARNCFLATVMTLVACGGKQADVERGSDRPAPTSDVPAASASPSAPIARCPPVGSQASGTACSRPEEMPCDYECEGTRARCSYGHWVVSFTQEEVQPPRCPTDAPAPGSVCAIDAVCTERPYGCTYEKEACCTAGSLHFTCLHGAWSAGGRSLEGCTECH